MGDQSGGGLRLFRPRDFDGSLADYVDRLQWHYREMVTQPGIELWGRPVVAGGGEAGDGRDSTFWHIVTEGWRRDRRLDVTRLAAVPRARDVLERAALGDSRIVWWRERRGKSSRKGWALHLCPADYSCVVILRECRHNFVLVTSYPVHGKHRGRLRKRARESWERGSTRASSFRHVLWRGCPEVVPAPLYAWAEHLA